MSRPSEPGLVIAGLGLRPGPDTTLDALRALAECERVYHDAPPEGAALVERHCPRVAPAPDAAEIVAAARTARVGLAVSLAPPWGGSLAEECRVLAARAKVPCRTVATISPLGGMVAQAAAFFGGGPFGALGMQAFEAASAIALRPEPVTWLPLVVYSAGQGPHPWAEVAAWLSGSYKPSHRLRLCASDGRPGESLRLDELARRELVATAVFIPPARKGARTRPAGPGASHRAPTVHVNSRAGSRRPG